MKIKMRAGRLVRAERGPADMYTLLTFADAYWNLLKHTQTVTKARTVELFQSVLSFLNISPAVFTAVRMCSHGYVIIIFIFFKLSCHINIIFVVLFKYLSVNLLARKIKYIVREFVVWFIHCNSINTIIVCMQSRFSIWGEIWPVIVRKTVRKAFKERVKRLRLG